MIAVRLEHFGIYAKDPQVLASWYVDVLGFRVVRTLEKAGRPPIFFLEADEGGEIEILPTKESRVERTLSQGGFSHIGLIVADFQAIQTELRGKGIELEGVRDTSNGWKIGYFADPEGNTIELVRR